MTEIKSLTKLHATITNAIKCVLLYLIKVIVSRNLAWVYRHGAYYTHLKSQTNNSLPLSVPNSHVKQQIHYEYIGSDHGQQHITSHTSKTGNILDTRHAFFPIKCMLFHVFFKKHSCYIALLNHNSRWKTIKFSKSW